MRVVPSVVIGLGSSGAYVIENLERILYEVLGDARTDLFQFFAIDTDMQRKEDVSPPGGRRSQTINVYERDLGRAIRDLTHILKDDFAWCPQDLRIPTAGAGNIRAGGRAMLFNKFPEIWNLIRTATARVANEAALPRTEEHLQALLNRRGLIVPPPIVNPASSVVYVVGTLAGGTCSGMCVDLGYAIHDAAPHVTRTGMFFIPDRTAGPVFLANTWAALRDLEYFCDHPDAFRAVWPSAHRGEHHYNGDIAKPYEQVYLISPQDESRQQRLLYQANSNSPLIVMMAMRLALDLLGGYEPRMAVLSNLNTQIGGPEKRRMFLNFNLRAVSFPKYEISEAAACMYAAESICAGWLDKSEYQGMSGKLPIKEESTRELGRKLWNNNLPSVCMGARANVNTGEWVAKILQRNLTKPEEQLLREFADEVQGTIYSQVAQQLPGRATELKRIIKKGFVQEMSQAQNLWYGELYLQGVRNELKHTLGYWDKLEIPTRRDHARWMTECRKLIHRMLNSYSTLGTWALGARREVLREEFEEVITRLEMHLMTGVLAELEQWINDELLGCLKSLSNALKSAQTLARSRAEAIKARLRDETGPTLKLSRSAREGFDEEIQSLSQQRLDLQVSYIKLNPESDEFEGLFAIDRNPQKMEDQRVFLDLKNLVQPELLARLGAKGSVNIVQEIQAQQRVPQAVTRRVEARALSIATDPGLSKDHTAVPAMVFARDEATAAALNSALLRENGNLPFLDPKGLPIFDHMVLFYQEGAGFDPGTLSDRDFFQRAYDAKANERSDYIDPLRNLKNGGAGAPTGVQP